MPSFEKTKVDPNTLSRIARNIDDSINAINNAFNAIDRTVGGTLLPAWQDVASNQFSKQYSIDQMRFRLTVTYLTQLNQQLKEAAGIFDGADGKAKDLVNRLSIG